MNTRSGIIYSGPAKRPCDEVEFRDIGGCGPCDHGTVNAIVRTGRDCRRDHGATV
jgi:hypothetical protein